MPALVVGQVKFEPYVNGGGIKGVEWTRTIHDGVEQWQKALNELGWCVERHPGLEARVGNMVFKLSKMGERDCYYVVQLVN